ncbi:MAG TPA: DUF2059 domain-containing protein [Candidatus Dormibacteraeota bacterium]|nr:DUF2059 domain-containing protein [Candidatus Dormibacteraeota bacterium]
MKAVLALIIIYVGTFFVAIQGVSQSSVEASEPSATAQNGSAQRQAADPIKDADVRSLMELIGLKDQVQDSVKISGEQNRDKLLTTVSNDDKGRTFVNAFSRDYENKFDVNQVTEQIVGIYDQHFTDDEIKGLLQFYGSPLGQKYASEMPKISREIQVASRDAASKAARESLQQIKNQYPEIGANAKLGIGQRAGQPQGQRQQVAAQQAQR